LVYTDDEAETRKYRLHSGDVLFNRTNTIDLVGKCAIYKGERSAIFAGYLIRINVDESALDSNYLNIPGPEDSSILNNVFGFTQVFNSRFFPHNLADHIYTS